MRNYLEKTIFNNKPNYAAAQCHDNKTCSKDYKQIQPRKAIRKIYVISMWNMHLRSDKISNLGEIVIGGKRSAAKHSQ
jgi:hypothetical protein